MSGKFGVVKTVIRLFGGLLGAGLWLGSGLGAGAQTNLQFSFFQDTLSGSPSQTITFAATVTNNGTAPVYLNTDNPIFNGPGTIDDSLFYSNFTGLLAVGQSITNQNILSITLNSDAAPGSYLGSFDIDGGSTDTASNLLATQNFGVNVALEGVPESSSLLLLTLGLGTLLVGSLVRRRAQV